VDAHALGEHAAVGMAQQVRVGGQPDAGGHRLVGVVIADPVASETTGEERTAGSAGR
jgi:hypothetical protein